MKDSISMLLKSNKKIPEIWTKTQCYQKIMKNFLLNENTKKLMIQNMLNNEQRIEYNQKLRQNLPKIIHKTSSYENLAFDHDLIDVIKMKRNRIKESALLGRKYKTLNEEYKDIIKEQNEKIVSPKIDSIEYNKNNILEYRKKIALKFKYYYEPKNNLIFEQENLKNNKIQSAFVKSKSCVDINDKDFNIKDISDNGLMKKNIRNPFKIISKIKERNFSALKKGNENPFLVTGMNNKKFSFQKRNEFNNNWIIYNKNNNKSASLILS